jgi:hypothetical protein
MNVPDSGKVMNFAMLLGLLVVMFIIYKLLAAVGIIKTSKSKKEDKVQAAAVEMMRTDEYWDASYYRGKQFKAIGDTAANLYAQQIRKALRGIGTDEEAIYAVFGRLYNLCNISEVSASYFLQYGNNLQTDLLNDLNKKEIATVMNIVNELPIK